MNLQELLEKWLLSERDSTPLWRLAIHEIDYESADDPSDGVEIAALAENIRQCGLIHPIIVERRQHQGKKYKLITGRRRLEAVALLGRTHISAIVIKDENDVALKTALSENLMRKEPHFLDCAEDLQTLLKTATIGEISRLFSIKEEILEAWLMLTKLSPYEKRLIRLLKLTENQACDLSRIENSTIRKLLLEKMAESGISCDRNALIARALGSPDPRLTQSEKIYVKDIRVFLNTVERAAEMMRSAGFETQIERSDGDEHYQFVITVAKSQSASLASESEDNNKVSRETSPCFTQLLHPKAVKVSRET